ncbi:hypothetical protein LTR78_009818 [Recurvomyces mirabilis]|uniref:XPG-I domain-containing protein n=1 Tax=Recurvomyces mirabilis TaxID=574656 RepID=A0AAE0TNV1_9PEZI|nr:hypothetical protein LTR78_009818 [Recurvomyces mirabilis]KAK5153054.1 hypothetical protein LTS14_007698 [Recurvomyces mirabilis]
MSETYEMGIHGLLRELGPAPRISLAKLAADHFSTADQPFRLAIDIQIWLFQIQCGKGGSNPALRTFYYRLLRLLSLNIWPLFVFDGPNKPLFKRNKKVGGQGVRVATVPEFLAKQLLKEFGFPWHVAPGEAEAECALFQREGAVDAVLSEDVDTLMFGSGVTLRNWTSESSTKSPTHVSLYREQETMARSKGVDRHGMILVALMSGGDYLPEGIPGCGPKVACDAARAGFGKELCALRKNDTAGMKLWKERLQHQIRTNEAKYFSRKNSGFSMPEDFPNQEVLGYYTHPCVSTPEKVQRLKESLKWDQPIEYAALRSFAADAFDWRCLGGAKKFIKNLAPALLVRELRRQGAENERLKLDEVAQGEAETKMVKAIHGKRNHSTVDGDLELRISFVPAGFVPIDLSMEDEDDDFFPAGGPESDADSESTNPPPSSADINADDDEEDDPVSPTKKKRRFKTFDPDQPEKLWILRTYLQVGCPLMVEEYEASLRDPKEFLKQRRKAKAVGKRAENIHTVPVPAKKTGGRKRKEKEGNDMPANALMAFGKVTKAGKESGKEKARAVLGESSSQGNEQRFAVEEVPAKAASFKMFSTLIPDALLQQKEPTVANRPSRAATPFAEDDVDVIDLSLTPRPFARFAATQHPSSPPKSPAAALKRAARQHQAKQLATLQKTPPRRKRRSAELSSPPVSQRSQRSITEWYSPSPRKARAAVPVSIDAEIVNLVSSSPAPGFGKVQRSFTPTPPNLRKTFVRSPSPTLPVVGGSLFVSPLVCEDPFSPGRLPDTVTKRRRKGPLRRWESAPVRGEVEDDHEETTPRASMDHDLIDFGGCGGALDLDAMDLAAPSPARAKASRLAEEDDLPDVGHDVDLEPSDDLPSPDSFLTSRTALVSKSPGLTAETLSAVRKEVAYPTPPTTSNGLPTSQSQVDAMPNVVGDPTLRPTAPAYTAIDSAHTAPPGTKSVAIRRSPRHPSSGKSPIQSQKQQKAVKKKAFLLRQSLEGVWKEVDAETLDMSGDGSGWRMSGRSAEIVSSNGGAIRGRSGKAAKAWRHSGVEILDLTGA